MQNPEAIMSEKTADRAIQRTSPVASEIDTSLTAEQRAERELAKLDEGMDLIMAKPENRARLRRCRSRPRRMNDNGKRHGRRRQTENVRRRRCGTP